MTSLPEQWYETFLDCVKVSASADALRQAAIDEKLADWTRHLTEVVVNSCGSLGWDAAAKGHLSERLPKPGEEYLGLDVMAFDRKDRTRWPLPAAVFELENQKDRAAYSLWKVLNVRVPLRAVFTYQADAVESVSFVRQLATEVIGPLTPAQRSAISGETVMVVGNRDESAGFPYGFFRSWLLNANTARFEKLY